MASSLHSRTTLDQRDRLNGDVEGARDGPAAAAAQCIVFDWQLAVFLRLCYSATDAADAMQHAPVCDARSGVPLPK